jgi:hypothetical protein
MGGIAGDPGFASETLRAHDAIEMSDLVTLSEFTMPIAPAGARRKARHGVGNRMSIGSEKGSHLG